MKFEVSREQLLRPLQLANAVVERRQTLPILGNVLLEASGTDFTLVATDLEVELSVTGESQASDTMRVTVGARRLLDACRMAPDGSTLRLEIEGERARLHAGDTKYGLGTLPADEFPRIDLGPEDRDFHVESTALKTLLDRTQFAMAQQDVRYYLNGLLLETVPGGLRAVATDGHRMAVSEIGGLDGVPPGRQVIVPRKSVIEANRMLAGIDEQVTLGLCEDHLSLRFATVDFSSKVIEGNFPDYERVIPAQAHNQAVIGREALRAALDRVAVVGTDKFSAVRLSFGTDTLHLAASNADNEQADGSVSMEYRGDAIEMGFNATYLLDVLSVLDSERVRLSLQNSNSSCLVVGEDEPDSRYVIMPMRL